MRIKILVSQTSPASVVMGLYEILQLALFNSRQAGEIKLVSADGAEVGADSRFRLMPDESMAQALACKTIDAFIIAPLGPVPEQGLSFDPNLLNAIASIGERSGIVSSVCTGAFLLAASGLVDGREVSTHWLFEESFRQAYPLVNLRSENLVVEDGKYLSSGGATAYQDMTLRLIERLLGRKLALKCAKLWMLTPDRVSQSEFADYQRFKRHGDDKVSNCQNWIESNFQMPIDVVALAQNACLSERHFKRRFKTATGDSPSQYWQRVRIDKAKRSLELSSKAVETIGLESGYEDMQFFRKLFKRHTGLTPNEYRKRYAQ